MLSGAVRVETGTVTDSDKKTFQSYYNVLFDWTSSKIHEQRCKMCRNPVNVIFYTAMFVDYYRPYCYKGFMYSSHMLSTKGDEAWSFLCE